MGYHNRICKAFCSSCKASSTWSWKPPTKAPTSWECDSCGLPNDLGRFERWPQLPRELYIGHEKNEQLKVYPTPPGHDGEAWALPYSIKSFIAQASYRLGGCSYSVSSRGEVMGETVFNDYCSDAREDTMWPEHWLCHMAGGWTRGHSSCPLWEKVQTLCQTEAERRFLHWYLGLAKDRNFPMLIPQVRIGIAERRRPDFILFVPLQYWKFKWYAIQLDRAHSPSMAANDDLRDADVSLHGYEVIRFKPEKQGYFESVRGLIERVELEMTQADVDPWTPDLAVEVPVIQKNTVPF